MATKVSKGSSTLKRWFRKGVSNKERGNILDSYIPYLKKRFEEGCHNSLQLYLELELRGFEGSTVTVQKYAARFLIDIATKVVRLDSISTKPSRYTTREGIMLFTKGESLLSNG